MTNEEKKKYIKKHWNVSSGKRISAMLKKYWKGRGAKDLTSEAVKIFGGT
tara:strand:- start:112 stop:261 length:150 start_codon:yes stop_codon:yes gene_type:complete